MKPPTMYEALTALLNRGHFKHFAINKLIYVIGGKEYFSIEETLQDNIASVIVQVSNDGQ